MIKWIHIRTSNCNQVNRHTIHTETQSILQCKEHQEEYINVLLLSFFMFNTLYYSFQCLTEADMGPIQLFVLLTIQIIAAKVHV